MFIGGEAVRQLVTRLGMPQPIVALFHRPPRPHRRSARARRRLVVVEGVDNPSNVGCDRAIAAALGWDGLLLDHTSADPLSRRPLRVAMGTAFTLPHARTNHLLGALDHLRRAGVVLYGLTPNPDAADLRSVGPGGRRAS